MISREIRLCRPAAAALQAMVAALSLSLPTRHILARNIDSGPQSRGMHTPVRRRRKFKGWMRELRRR